MIHPSAFNYPLMDKGFSLFNESDVGIVVLLVDFQDGASCLWFLSLFMDGIVAVVVCFVRSINGISVLHVCIHSCGSVQLQFSKQLQNVVSDIGMDIPYGSSLY